MSHRKLALIVLPALALGMLGMDCIPPELLEGLNCPNPGVVSFEATLLSKSGTSGTFRLDGVVRNVGLQAFNSSAGQQAVQIWRGSTMVAEEVFTNLAPGEEVTISVEVTWSSSDEFPPDYMLLISYDPDIYSDANDENDDCYSDNNSATLTATELNTLFAAGT